MGLYWQSRNVTFHNLPAPVNHLINIYATDTVKMMAANQFKSPDYIIMDIQGTGTVSKNTQTAEDLQMCLFIASVVTARSEKNRNPVFKLL